MDPASIFLWALTVPTLVVTALSLHAMGKLPSPTRDALALTAAGLVCAAGVYANLGADVWPMNAATDRLLVALPTILLLAGVASWLRDWTLVVPLLVLLALVTSGVMVLRSGTFTPPGGWTWTTVILASFTSLGVMGVVSGSAALLAWARPGAIAPLVVAGMTLASAVLVILTGSASLGTTAMVAGASVLGLALMTLIRGRGFVPGIVATTAMVAPVVLLTASEHVWSRTPVWASLVVLAAPPLALTCTLFTRRASPRMRLLIELLTAALPAVVLLGWFAMKFAREYQQGSGY
jgi:hypothetical protein